MLAFNQIGVLSSRYADAFSRNRTPAQAQQCIDACVDHLKTFFERHVGKYEIKRHLRIDLLCQSAQLNLAEAFVVKGVKGQPDCIAAKELLDRVRRYEGAINAVVALCADVLASLQDDVSTLAHRDIKPENIMIKRKALADLDTVTIDDFVVCICVVSSCARLISLAAGLRAGSCCAR